MKRHFYSCVQMVNHLRDYLLVLKTTSLDLAPGKDWPKLGFKNECRTRAGFGLQMRHV